MGCHRAGASPSGTGRGGGTRITSASLGRPPRSRSGRPPPAPTPTCWETPTMETPSQFSELRPALHSFSPDSKSSPRETIPRMSSREMWVERLVHAAQLGACAVAVQTKAAKLGDSLGGSEWTLNGENFWSFLAAWASPFCSPPSGCLSESRLGHSPAYPPETWRKGVSVFARVLVRSTRLSVLRPCSSGPSGYGKPL